MPKVTSQHNLSVANPKLAQEWHPSKNGNLTPRDVPPGSHKKVWWQCKKGHEWQAIVKSRSRSGCPYCGSRKVCKDNCLATQDPKLVREWHPTKNGELTPEDVMSKSNKKVWWQCEKGHEYQSVINYKSQGGGCPCCSRRKVREDNCLFTVNPRLAREWHPSKNGMLTPKDVTPKSQKKVWWQCKRGHEWESSLANRSAAKGCPYCNSSTSVMELKIYAEIKSVFPDTKLKVKINKIECDVYIPSLSVGVEYDGVYWHRDKQEKDRAKNRIFENGGIHLIRVREIGLNKITENDVIYDYAKKEEKQLVDTLLKRIKRLPVLSVAAQERVDGYLEKSELANNEGFINLLDRLPSPLPGSSLAEQDPALAKTWHPSKNGKLTPQDVTSYSNKNIWWQCDKGHEWKSIVGNRSKGQGCPYCSGRRAFGDNCLAKANLQLAKEWHLSKNGKLTPKDVTPKSNRKAWWQCARGHEWEAVVASRSQGSGCPYCAGNRVAKETSLAVKNPKLAKEWHPIKNGKLKPEDVTSGSNKKVWWQCHKGHAWEAVICSRSAGNGCPYCNGRYVCNDNCLATKYPGLAKEWHPTKNGKLTSEDVMPKSHTKVWWQCQKGHEWEIRVADRSNGNGCPFCAGRKRNSKQLDLL